MANVTKALRLSGGDHIHANNVVGNLEGGSISSRVASKSNTSWPIIIKLTTDSMRWDSLKISPSKEFEEFFLAHMNESSRKSLESWIPINIAIYDVDTCETYDSKLFKKESFWFDPMPVLGEKQNIGKHYFSSSHKSTMWETPCYDLEKARKEFVYSIQPFRHIIRKRDLKYDQEIGFRFNGGNVIVGFEFSVLDYSSNVDMYY